MRTERAPHLVSFSYLIDDLSEIADEELRTRAMTALGRLVEVCFKHARTNPQLIHILDGWCDVMLEVQRAPNGLGALEPVMRYILLVLDYVEPHDLQALLERVAVAEAKDTIMTAGERLILQGEERGLEKGIQQGRQQGERAAL